MERENAISKHDNYKPKVYSRNTYTNTKNPNTTLKKFSKLQKKKTKEKGENKDVPKQLMKLIITTNNYLKCK